MSSSRGPVADPGQRTVDDLARHGSDPRTLNRHFRAAMGMPPGEWLQRERLRLAQRLLETTDDPIDTLARAGTTRATTAQFTCAYTPRRALPRTFRASGGYDEARRRSRNAASRVSGNEIRKKTTATAP